MFYIIFIQQSSDDLISLWYFVSYSEDLLSFSFEILYNFVEYFIEKNLIKTTFCQNQFNLFSLGHKFIELGQNSFKILCNKLPEKIMWMPPIDSILCVLSSVVLDHFVSCPRLETVLLVLVFSWMRLQLCTLSESNSTYLEHLLVYHWNEKKKKKFPLDTFCPGSGENTGKFSIFLFKQFFLFEEKT